MYPEALCIFVLKEIKQDVKFFVYLWRNTRIAKSKKTMNKNLFNIYQTEAEKIAEYVFRRHFCSLNKY